MKNLTFKAPLTKEANEILFNMSAVNNKEAKELKVKKASEILLTLSDGNSKLKSTDEIAFLIWNITADYSDILNMRICNNATESCKKLCYAKKAQRLYFQTRDRRNQNTIASISNEFIQIMIDEIDYHMNLKKNKNKTFFVRIHESGEFYSMDYLTKWIYIANHFKGNSNIVFMAYTKELHLLKEAFKTYGKDNININFKASEWADTSEEMKALAKELGLTIFTAMKADEMKDSKFIKCPASNGITCDLCKLCYTKSLNTAIEIH